MEKIITKAEINKMLVEAMKECEVIAPVKIDDIVFLKSVKTTDKILFDYSNSLNSLKEFFFPEREVLFEYAEGIPKFALDIKPGVIFGVRPCDANSLSILDKIFGGDYRDTYYFERRDKTILIGLSCEDPLETCFCTSMDEGGPNSNKNLDILLTELDNDTYFAEVISKKGEDFIKQYGKEPDKKHKEERQKKAEEAKKKITRKIKIPEDFEKSFKNEYWDKVSRKCIACGICRYFCPTCTCFSIADEDKERIRYWQPCSFACFTKEAAGSNPRIKKSERYKQWYFHKFDYSKKNIGMFACVGCGRCTMKCPVKTDLTEVLKGLSLGVNNA